jgi:hypothetical protein
MHILSPIIAALIAGGIISFANAQQSASEGPQPAEQEPALRDQQAAGTEPLPHPIDCTFTEARLCKTGSDCSAAEALGEVPLPARFLIHFEQQIIASVNADGLPHVSTIGVLARSGDSLILQGVDGATGWTIQGSTSDEMASFTVASHDSVLNAFGTCKAIE